MPPPADRPHFIRQPARNPLVSTACTAVLANFNIRRQCPKQMLTPKHTHALNYPQSETQTDLPPNITYPTFDRSPARCRQNLPPAVGTIPRLHIQPSNGRLSPNIPSTSHPNHPAAPKISIAPSYAAYAISNHPPDHHRHYHALSITPAIITTEKARLELDSTTAATDDQLASGMAGCVGTSPCCPSPVPAPAKGSCNLARAHEKRF